MYINLDKKQDELTLLSLPLELKYMILEHTAFGDSSLKALADDLRKNILSLNSIHRRLDVSEPPRVYFTERQI